MSSQNLLAGGRPGSSSNAGEPYNLDSLCRSDVCSYDPYSPRSLWTEPIVPSGYRGVFALERLRPVVVNPDIAGKGVIINFVGTTYIVMGLLFLRYILTYDARDGTSIPCEQAHKSESQHVKEPNPIDKAVLANLRKFLKIPPKLKATKAKFDDCILSLCDVQVVTGFALLVSGFVTAVKPSDGHLDAFHWGIVVYLAWFCAVTHLVGLAILPTSLCLPSWVKAARFTIMALFAVTLVVASVPTGFFNWISTFSQRWNRTGAFQRSPAICFFDIRRALEIWTQTRACREGFHPMYDPGRKRFLLDLQLLYMTSMQRMIASNVILLARLFTCGIRLFKVPRLLKKSCEYFQKLSRGLGDKALSAVTSPPIPYHLVDGTSSLSRRPFNELLHMWDDLATAPFLSIWVLFHLHADLFSSALFELCFLLTTVIAGSISLLDALQLGSYGSSPWGFGQLMALVLLAGPILLVLWKFMETDSPNGSQPCRQPDVRDPVGGTDDSSALGHLPRDATRATHQASPNSVEIELQAISEHDAPLPYQHQTPAAVPFPTPWIAPSEFVSERDLYETSCWIWPSVLISSCSMLLLVGLALWRTSGPSVNLVITGYDDPRIASPPISGRGWDIVQFWYYTLPYIICGYPFAAVGVTLIGLNLESFSAILSLHQQIILIICGALIHGVFLFLNWPSYSWDSPFFHQSLSASRQEFLDWYGGKWGVCARNHCPMLYYPLKAKLLDNIMVAALLFGLYIIYCSSRSTIAALFKAQRENREASARAIESGDSS